MSMPKSDKLSVKSWTVSFLQTAKPHTQTFASIFQIMLEVIHWTDIITWDVSCHSLKFVWTTIAGSFIKYFSLRILEMNYRNVLLRRSCLIYNVVARVNPWCSAQNVEQSTGISYLLEVPMNIGRNVFSFQAFKFVPSIFYLTKEVSAIWTFCWQKNCHYCNLVLYVYLFTLVKNVATNICTLNVCSESTSN